MIVALDVDRVLVDASPLYREAWRKAGITVFGAPPDASHQTTYDFRQIPGISDPQKAHDIAVGVYARPDLYDGLAPMPGVLEALDTLRARTDRVIAISHPTIGHADSKLRFLRALGFADIDTFLASDKNAIEWDVLVDDAPHHALAGLAAGRRVVVFGAPWNQNVVELDEHRVYGWAATVKAVLDVPERSALQVADDLINGPRQQDYGHPRDDFSRTAGIWTGLFRDKLREGESFGYNDVWQAMIGVKLSRLQSTPGHYDSIVDIAGYAGCGEKCL